MWTSPQQSVFRAGLDPASGSLTGRAGLEEGKEKRGRKKREKFINLKLRQAVNTTA